MTAPFNGTHFGWTQPDAVWEQLLRPWFAACARLGWEAPGQSAVPVLLLPDTGLVAWVKAKTVAEGIGCLGVHFHTPGTLRGLLCRAYGVEASLALREDLHLVMGQAARSLPDNPVAQAAAIDPATLTRLCDRIDRADWRQDGFATAAGRQLARRYFELLAAQGLRTAAQAERELLQRALGGAVNACGYLLAAGFGPEHCESLPLLRAAVLSTEQAPIVCLDTREDAAAGASALSLAWQAGCEEAFGPALELPQPALAEASAPAEPEPLADWAQAVAAHGTLDPQQQLPLRGQLRLQVFRSLKEEAQNAVEHVCHWLGQAGQSAVDFADASADTADIGDRATGAVRIGIILPGGGSLLGREIAARLSERGVSHYDSLGHQPARTSAQRQLDAWCAWQTSNQLDDFTSFLAELVREGGLSARAYRQWERMADQAFAQTLCAELGVIFASLGVAPAAEQTAAGDASVAAPSGSVSGTASVAVTDSATATGGSAAAEGALPDAGAIAEAGMETSWRQILARWVPLPAEGSFAAFWARTAPVLAGFGWPQRLEPLLQRAEAFAGSFTAPLPRAAFIAWLRTVVQVPGRTRNACGHEPFAPVHLVTLAEASRQRWTHLCLVGMVHSLWPPSPAESALLDAARCTYLNRRAEQPSRFGQGQTVIGDGHTYLISSGERRELFTGAFLRLLREGGARRIVLSRYRFEPGAQQAEAFASEYFLRAVYAACGSLETDETAAVPASTRAAAPDPAAGTGGNRLGRPFAVPLAGAPLPVGALEQMAVPALVEAEAFGGLPFPQVAHAYTRRRDPQTPFDGYSYGLLRPPARPLRLSCSHWAEALSRPANAWYRYVLRLRKRRLASQTDVRRQSLGIWVHRWINPSPEAAEGYRNAAGAAPVFLARPDVSYWRSLAYTRATALRRQVEGAYRRVGRQLPQWWLSDWNAALATAFSFVDALGVPSAEPPRNEENASLLAGIRSADACWSHVCGEYSLPAVRLDLEGHPLDGLELEGIVDLLLADAPVALGGVARSSLWVVDYKTGGDETLSKRSWESRGAGLQLVLYALALQAHGVADVQMTLLKKDEAPAPQLALADLDPQAPVWQRLLAPVRLGVFGMEGALRDSHIFRGDYPLATLPVDPVILGRKAALTLAAVAPA